MCSPRQGRQVPRSLKQVFHTARWVTRAISPPSARPPTSESSTMKHARLLAAAGAMLLAFSPVAAHAQQPLARIEGRITSAEDSSAVALALVRLVADSLDPTSHERRTMQQAVTSAAGTYQFREVNPGLYRVQLL